MGKQRKKGKQPTDIPLPANKINWEARARELVHAGILSPVALDNGGYERPFMKKRDKR